MLSGAHRASELLYLLIDSYSALASGALASEPAAPAKKAPEPVKLTATQLDRISAGSQIGSLGRHDSAILGLHSGQAGSGSEH